VNKWPIVHLEDVCDAKSSNIAQKDLIANEGQYPIYGASGLIKYVDFYAHEIEYIGIVKDGAGVGRATIHPAKSSVIGTMQALLPKSTTNPSYLFYVISNMDLARYHTGATIPHIYFKDYKKELLPLPPIEVQQKVVNVLDLLNYLIKKRKEQIAKLDLLVKSQFIEMFGGNQDDSKWDKVQLVEICKSPSDIKCGPFGTQLYNADYRKEGIPVYGIPQVNSAFKKMPSEFVESDKAVQLDAFSLVYGDVVLSRKGNVGTCAIFPKTAEQGIMHSDVLRIRPDNGKINPLFLVEQLHNSQYVQWQIEQVSHGAIMAGTNVTKLKGIMIDTPPLELQNQFSDFVQAVDKSKFEMQKGLEKLELLYKSLMQKCFSGELFK